MQVLGLRPDGFTSSENIGLTNALLVKIKNEKIAEIGLVSNSKLVRFDIKQPVFYVNMNWDILLKLNKKNSIQHKDVSKYPAVNRDLAIVVNKTLHFEDVEKATAAARINKLTSISLFDIFESEKIGADKKSMAISFTFLDEEKTMTDNDIDGMMNKIIGAYEKELGAEIRK
jgi:phenylalanyl-tRNA synthetase beta chain